MTSEPIEVTATSWKDYADDPLPGWCRRSGSLFDMPVGDLGSPPTDIETAVCSVAFDTTASTRIGARDGPAAIREASLAYSSQAKSRGPRELLNLRTGVRMRPRERRMADFGDLHIYPSDPQRQMRATAAEIVRLAMIAPQVVALGGEHTVSYANFVGVASALRQRSPGARLGYVQIDHHFDFGEVSVLHGLYYHGSNARRISELPFVRPEAMAFVGMGDLTGAAQFRAMGRAGMTIRTMREIRDRGFEACLAEACRAAARASDALFVSIDIDVCDMATAPGTGHATVGGIGAADFLSIANVLRDFTVAGLDLVEVNPRLDPSGATAHLGARLLFETLMLEVSSEPEA